MAWTDENIETLKSMWAAGATASEIGEHIGVSRNGVLGKARRLDLEARCNPISTRQALFDRMIDLIADADEPVAIDAAARTVGLGVQIAESMWADLCRKGGEQFE